MCAKLVWQRDAEGKGLSTKQRPTGRPKLSLVQPELRVDEVVEVRPALHRTSAGQHVVRTEARTVWSWPARPG